MNSALGDAKPTEVGWLTPSTWDGLTGWGLTAERIAKDAAKDPTGLGITAQVAMAG
jgi:hypothetical protein